MRVFGFTKDIMVTAAAAFHEPVAGSWLDDMPAVGNCQLNPPSVQLASSYLDVGSFVYLTSGTRSVSLPKSGSSAGPMYTTSALDSNDFVSTAYYDVQAPDGGDIGPIEIVDAVLTPMGFDAISPQEMLYVHPSSAFSAPVSKSGASFSWSPAGNGTIVIIVQAYSPDGTLYLGEVVCRDWDSGSLYIPGSYFSTFPNLSLLAVFVNRYETSESVLSNNGSTVEGIAQKGVLGTAILVP